MRVSLKDAEYILDNIEDMEEMEAELLDFPSYL
jgi:hypothetical protein